MHPWAALRSCSGHLQFSLPFLPKSWKGKARIFFHIKGSPKYSYSDTSEYVRGNPASSVYLTFFRRTACWQPDPLAIWSWQPFFFPPKHYCGRQAKTKGLLCLNKLCLRLAISKKKGIVFSYGFRKTLFSQLKWKAYFSPTIDFLWQRMIEKITKSFRRQRSISTWVTELCLSPDMN